MRASRRGATNRAGRPAGTARAGGRSSANAGSRCRGRRDGVGTSTRTSRRSASGRWRGPLRRHRTEFRETGSSVLARLCGGPADYAVQSRPVPKGRRRPGPAVRTREPRRREMDDATLEELAGRLRGVEDVLAVQRVVLAYGPAADAGAAGLAASLWLDDGVYDWD